MHPDTVWGIPYSFGRGSFVEPGVDAYVWSSHLLYDKFLDVSECPRGTLLETRSMDTLVNVDGAFSGHYLVDGRERPFYPSLWEPLCQAQVGKKGHYISK